MNSIADVMGVDGAVFCRFWICYSVVGKSEFDNIITHRMVHPVTHALMSILPTANILSSDCTLLRTVSTTTSRGNVVEICQDTQPCYGRFGVIYKATFDNKSVVLKLPRSAANVEDYDSDSSDSDSSDSDDTSPLNLLSEFVIQMAVYERSIDLALAPKMYAIIQCKPHHYTRNTSSCNVPMGVMDRCEISLYDAINQIDITLGHGVQLLTILYHMAEKILHAQQTLGFMHRDAHICNVMLSSTNGQRTSTIPNTNIVIRHTHEWCLVDYGYAGLFTVFVDGINQPLHSSGSAEFYSAQDRNTYNPSFDMRLLASSFLHDLHYQAHRLQSDATMELIGHVCTTLFGSFRAYLDHDERICTRAMYDTIYIDDPIFYPDNFMRIIGNLLTKYVGNNATLTTCFE